MTPDHPYFFRRVLSALTAILLAGSVFGGASVFEMPDLHVRHMRLLALMDKSHQEGDYVTMEVVSREGIKAGTADELWYYNLACALTLQGKREEALGALDHAITLGFLDIEHLTQDPDFASLRDTEALNTRIARMRELSDSADEDSCLTVALAPGADGTVMQSASNTLWSFDAALFHTRVLLPSNPPANAVYQGPEAERINAWLREGTATGTAGLLYVNRDNDTQAVDLARFPGMTRLGYVPEMVDRKLSIGLPNTLFSQPGLSGLVPVIGHSAMGYLNSAYWRSQPRAVSCDFEQASRHSILLFGNQLFFYPAFSDYTMQGGDLFPANVPSFIAVAGQSGAERPFVEAAVAALAAMRPETRAELTRSFLLMPTLSMLFRASQKTVRHRSDYLTGRAHPTVFDGSRLDTARLVEAAHALTTNNLPPLVLINVRRETQTQADRDFFDLADSEQLLDTPVAVARVFRGIARTRDYEIQALCRQDDVKLHWVVLHGDPAKVTFTPSPTNAALMTVTVAHHTPPFDTPLDDDTRIRTCRVDIGVIAEASKTFSMPAILSIYFLANEKRFYADDGRPLAIDYTRSQAVYTDPLLSVMRHWKDVFEYDPQGNLIGWRRFRGFNTETFTAYGHRGVEFDASGRVTRAHLIRYMPRKTRKDENEESLPELAQVDDAIAIPYRYANENDRVGEPDLTALPQEIPPFGLAIDQ
jgi:hypothetical protein